MGRPRNIQKPCINTSFSTWSHYPPPPTALAIAAWVRGEEKFVRWSGRRWWTVFCGMVIAYDAHGMLTNPKRTTPS